MHYADAHRKKMKVNILNGEESQGQEKKADEFLQIFFVCVHVIRE